jgi:signal transduction histidine kinase
MARLVTRYRDISLAHSDPLLVGPSVERAKVFAETMGLKSFCFVECEEGKLPAFSVLCQAGLQMEDWQIQDIQARLTLAMKNAIPLAVCIYDDEESPRRKMAEIAMSLFVRVSISESEDCQGKRIPAQLYLARRLQIYETASVNNFMKTCKAWIGQPKSGLVVFADAFDFPDQIDGEPVKRLKDNAKLVDLEAYPAEVIIRYAKVLEICEAMAEQILSGSCCPPLIIPMTRLWSQSKIRLVEQQVDLPVIPKVMFSSDQTVCQAFARTVLSILMIYDGFLRSSQSFLDVSSWNPMIEAQALLIRSLGVFVAKEPRIFMEMMKDLNHDTAYAVTQIRRLLRKMGDGVISQEDGIANVESAIRAIEKAIRLDEERMLMRFSVQDETSTEDILAIVREVAEEIETRHQFIEPRVRCMLDFQEESVYALTVKSLLRMVLAPILDNAFDAVVEKAKKSTSHRRWQPQITVRVSVVPVTKLYDWVRIDVEDNGVGIHSESPDMIFEKGWTTKTENLSEIQRGKGLNDVLAHLEALGAEHRILPVTGGGTCFQIFLTRKKETVK